MSVFYVVLHRARVSPREANRQRIAPLGRVFFQALLKRWDCQSHTSVNRNTETRTKTQMHAFISNQKELKRQELEVAFITSCIDGTKEVCALLWNSILLSFNNGYLQQKVSNFYDVIETPSGHLSVSAPLNSYSSTQHAQSFKMTDFTSDHFYKQQDFTGFILRSVLSKIQTEKV